LLLLGAVLVPAASSAQVVVQVGVEPPPPVVVVQAQVEPPPPVIVQAQVEAPPPAIIAPELVYEPAYYSNLISAGLGVPICGFGGIVDVAGGSGCIDNTFLWFNIPVVYRYRFHEYMAAGGGLMVNVFAGGNIGAVGVELLGSFRFYALPDWIYIDANVLFGFPWISFMPSVGVQVPLGHVNIFFENQIWLSYIYAAGYTLFFGFWQPVLGVEFAF
jgi:hypothetical protein